MRIVVAAFAASAVGAATGALASGGLDSGMGKTLFERDWLPASTSSDPAGGLGPLFAAQSCAGCHVGPTLGARFTDAPGGRVAGRGLVMRFGDSDGRPDPLYGYLLETEALPGLKPEGRVVLTASADTARSYLYQMDLLRGPLAPATHAAPRVAPPIVGRAALERIDANAVLALADPDDRNGDGISGRARMIATAAGDVLGRYGWKAATPDIATQVADAFDMEIGLSSARRPLAYGDCTAEEPDCRAAASGEGARYDGGELAPETVDLVAAYVRSLSAPSRGGRSGRRPPLRGDRLRRLPRAGNARNRRRHGRGPYRPSSA